MTGQGVGDYTPTTTNILKSRDDPAPVLLIREGVSSNDVPTFKLMENSNCSWAKSNEDIGRDKLRTRIEPWLTALCQSEHLSLLLGSGLTNAVHLLATGKTGPGMAAADFGDFKQVVDSAAERSAESIGRGKPNIEDQVRVANELARGLEILGQSDGGTLAKAKALNTKIADVLATFAADVLRGEQGLINAKVEERDRAFTYLVSFLMSFASRTGTRDRLHVFTTNYDRLIEAGAEAAGMHLLDRFVGTLAPIFRSSRLDLDLHYNPPGIRGEPRYLEGVARFTKLHGSLDWVNRERNIRRVGLPFGADSVEPYLKAAGTEKANAMHLMIYPNAAKDRETAAYPFVELFRDFAAAVCRPNHTLVVFGYSLGDEHINRVIEDMLTIPSAHLVLMAYDDPQGRIMKTYERLGKPAQTSLMIGDHVGAFQSLVDHYLPKPAIDKTTFRMAELLKSRWGANQGESPGTTAPPTFGEQGEV